MVFTPALVFDMHDCPARDLKLWGGIAKFTDAKDS